MPKGTVLVECGKMLKRGKYKIKVLNTINFAKSMHYNPFAYTMGNGGLRVAAAMADKPAQRASLKEKLEAFKVKVAGKEKPENHKEKGKEVTM